MAVRDRHDVRPFPVDLAVQKALEKPAAPARIAGLAVQRELHDVGGGHQRRRQGPGHQEAIGVAGVAHRHVTGRIEHSLVGEDATRRGEIVAIYLSIYFHGITETWIAPGAPSPPTDLIA